MSTVAKEGAGWSGVCDCGWFVWNQRRAITDAATGTHDKKCPGFKARPKSEAPKRAASSTAWDSREEGSSWIDKL